MMNDDNLETGPDQSEVCVLDLGARKITGRESGYKYFCWVRGKSGVVVDDDGNQSASRQDRQGGVWR